MPCLALVASLVGAVRQFDAPGLTLVTLPNNLKCASIVPRPVAALDGALTKKVKTKLASAFDAVEAREHWPIFRALKSLCRIPPVTACFMSMASFLAFWSWAMPDSQLQRWLAFDWRLVRAGQLWRLYSPFLNLGPLWLEFLVLAQSLTMYMSGVEVYFCMRPGKFVELLTFAMSSLSFYAVLEGLYRGHFASMDNLAFGLSVFFVYYWSRCNEGAKINCLDLVEIQAEWVPLLVLVQNFLLGQVSTIDLAAIVYAYLYFNFANDAETLWPFTLARCEWMQGLYEPFVKEMAN